MEHSGELGDGVLALDCWAGQWPSDLYCPGTKEGRVVGPIQAWGCESLNIALEPPDYTDGFQQPRILDTCPALPYGQHLIALNSPSQALSTFSPKNDWSYRGQGRPWGQRDTVAGTKQADVFYLEIVQPLVKHCTHYLKTRAQGSGSKEGDGFTISTLWLLGQPGITGYVVLYRKGTRERG